MFRIYIPTTANGELINETTRTATLDAAIDKAVADYGTCRTWNFQVHSPTQGNGKFVSHPATVIEVSGKDIKSLSSLAATTAARLGCRILLESSDKPRRVWV